MTLTELLLIVATIVAPSLTYLANNVRVVALEKELARLRVRVFELETILKRNKIDYPIRQPYDGD